jgi:hypothetical protein
MRRIVWANSIFPEFISSLSAVRAAMTHGQHVGRLLDGVTHDECFVVAP